MTATANTAAREGCDRCYCGCKYWESDRCIDCGTAIADCLADPEWVRENRPRGMTTRRLDAVDLRAAVAARAEDLRIARKHRDEAEDRFIAGRGSRQSAVDAQEWADNCLDRLCEARERMAAA